MLEADGIVKRVREQRDIYSGESVCGRPCRKKQDCSRYDVSDNYIFPKTIQSIEHVLFKEGYSVQIAFTNNLVNRERTILEDILERMR